MLHRQGEQIRVRELPVAEQVSPIHHGLIEQAHIVEEGARSDPEILAEFVYQHVRNDGAPCRNGPEAEDVGSTLKRLGEA